GEVDAAFGVSHHRLAVPHRGGESAERRDHVAAPRKFLPYCVRDAGLHLDVAAAEGSLREARRLERHLYVHSEIHNIGHELGVRLRLVPATHNAESDRKIAFAHERWNDGMQRPLPPGE